MESVVKARYKLRQLSGLNNQCVVVDEPSTTSKEKSRDEIAKKVGFKSGRQYERAHNVLNKIDKLKEQGNADDAELLTDILNKAPSTAEEFISRVDIERLYLSAHELYM